MKSSRNLKRILAAIAIFAVLVIAVGAYALKVYIPDTAAPRSFPQTDGELQVSGLDGPVEIYRDEMGIPYIYAGSIHDLFFAQGYVHAQERFWQMDFWRHIGSGRLSEMFGESQLETDQFLRTLGWRQTAEEEYAALGPESLAILDAYVEGVNAYIRGREPVEISLEYLILTGVLNREYVIEPWTPVHSLTWGKVMAWDLAGNMGAEIERAVLLQTLTPEQLAEIYPAYPEDHPVIVPQIGGEAAVTDRQTDPVISSALSRVDIGIIADKLDLLAAVTGPYGPGIGSNSWAISGEHTASGMPLLANDPHLGIQMPSIWFQNNLRCAPKSDACPFDVSGFSFAGVPGVVIGHNDRIAWGFTNVGPDVMDLYIERLNPDNPNQYEVNGDWVDFETREETIQIAGGEPVTLTVRTTRHGPVVTDTFGPLKDDVDLEEDPEALPFRERAGIDLPEEYVLSLAWTALSSSTPFEAIWGFNLAQNWEEFRQAAENFHVPAQNLVYADVDGNIGYQMPGDIPIRNAGNGWLPVPGWTDEYDWNGFIPFEDLPYAFNPPGGYIATANNQVHPWEYAYLVSTDWDYGFRAQRIVKMIESSLGEVSVADIQAMQADAASLNAETLVPLLMQANLGEEAEEIREQFLADWDYQESAESQSAMVFEWFWWSLLMKTFSDELPEDYWPGGGSRWYQVIRNLVQQPDNPWWDDINTEQVETRDDITALAFEETVEQIRKEHGRNPDAWPVWGDLHGATFRNGTLGESGIGPIEALFNRGPFPTGGGPSIVNATGWRVGQSFEVESLPSMRMIIDLSDLNNSVTMHTTGQSGHAFHPHYADMAPMWAAVEYYPMLWDEHAITESAASRLRLVP